MFLKNRKIHRKAPMLESLFNKVARPEPCFPVNFAKLLRTRFLQKSSGGCYWLFWSIYICIKLERRIPCQRELPQLYTNLANLSFSMNLTNFVPKSQKKSLMKNFIFLCSENIQSEWTKQYNICDQYKLPDR